MLQQDPPAHTRLRNLVSRAFTPRAVGRLEPTIVEVVDACLDRVAGGDRLDVNADLALPVPSTLICEMLGVPLKDRELFTRWTSEATHGLAAQLAPKEVLVRAREASVSLGGTIGFIGLLMPHIMRFLIGADSRLLIPASAAAGGAFLCLTDLIGRSVLPPMEVPAGIITAILGAPYFLYLLRRKDVLTI